MDVAITELRAHLGKYIDRARDGAVIIVTDRGAAVAKLVAAESADVIARLTADGVISSPTPSARPDARTTKRVRARGRGNVADLVSEQRR